MRQGLNGFIISSLVYCAGLFLSPTIVVQDLSFEELFNPIVCNCIRKIVS